LAILAGWIVKNILENEAAFPFPVNYSLIFLLSTVTLAIAFTGFALIREPVYPVQRQSESLGVMLRRAIFLVKINANFRRLLVSRAILGIGIGLAPFYVVHASQSQDVSGGIIGIFLSAQMAGAALSNILWAWLADTRGNKMVIVGTLASSALASLLALILSGTAPAAYVLVFVLIGAMLSGMRLGYSNFILEMAQPEMRATCVALQNTLIAPITLLPLLAGVLIAETSFGLVFGVQTLLMIGGLIIALNLLDPRSDKAGACITQIR
jgi:Na+/melibiose symporter-like transporter